MAEEPVCRRRKVHGISLPALLSPRHALCLAPILSSLSDSLEVICGH
jgi:hypothetical protein